MDPTFQYAGGVRIPPKQFQLRNRIEHNTKDMVNLNTYKHIETDVPDFTYNFPKLTYAKGRTYETPLNRSIGYSHTNPKKTRDIYGFDISYNDAGSDRAPSYATQTIGQSIDIATGYKKLEYKVTNIPYQDMSPQNTRYDARDYKQSQPYVAGGPDLAYNPYFDRYDPVTDPRNVIRELRSAVYEDKGGDHGYEESQKKLKRHFENRWVPEEIITDDLMDTFLRHDTVLPQIKDDNKYSSKNINKNLFDPKTFKSPDTCDSIPTLKTIKPTVTMKDQIDALLKRQKLQDEEDKKNIDKNNKHFERVENIKLEELKKKKEIIHPFPKEPVFLGTEETTEKNIIKRVLSDKTKFNQLVSLKPNIEIHYYKTNMVITLPLQPVTPIQYYKTNMVIEIDVNIQYYKTNMIIKLPTN